MVTGDWVATRNKDRTNMAVNVHLNNLAKSLARWNVEPVVDAGNGDIIFHGGWDNSLLNFSLSGVNGNMDMQFKGWNYYTFKPETEEKLDWVSC